MTPGVCIGMYFKSDAETLNASALVNATNLSRPTVTAILKII